MGLGFLMKYDKYCAASLALQASGRQLVRVGHGHRACRWRHAGGCAQAKGVDRGRCPVSKTSSVQSGRGSPVSKNFGTLCQRSFPVSTVQWRRNHGATWLQHQCMHPCSHAQSPLRISHGAGGIGQRAAGRWQQASGSGRPIAGSPQWAVSSRQPAACSWQRTALR